MNQTIIPNIDLTNNLTTEPQLETIIISGTAEIALVTINENNTAIADFDSTLTGPLTFSIAGEEDGTFAEDPDFFTIDPNTGVLSFINAPDFENPLDFDGDNIYQVDVQVTSGNTSSLQVLDVQVLDVEQENPEPPEELEIIGNTPGEVTNISIEENSSVVVDVDSSLEGTGNVTYSILSAADGSAAEDLEVFTIDPNTGVLSFINAPDFENPLDQGGDNVYQVDVVATSGNESVVQFIDVTVTNDASEIPTTPSTPPTPDAIRINAGGSSYTDAQGNIWQADRYFNNGRSFSTNSAIAETLDDTLYQTERFARDLSYEIPLANGNYTVNLYFAEVFFNDSNQRVFDLSAEGQLVIDDLDIFAVGGGNNTAFDRSFDINVSDGELNLDFLASSNNAKISAIEITRISEPTTPTPPTPPEELAIIGNTPGEVTNISIQENNTIVTDVNSSLEGSGNVTYSILSAADGSVAEDLEVFTIDPNTGVLSFINAPDFENPLDQGGDNVYQVDVVATSGNESVVQFIDVTVTNDASEIPTTPETPTPPTPPEELAIIGNTPGEVTNISINENNSFVVDVEVNVTGNLTYRILGVEDQSFAEDQGLFTIDPNTGVLSFNNAPDFENPLDLDGDNVYQVDIEVTSGGNTAIQFIDVTVLDVAENGLPSTALSFNQVAVNLAEENTYLVTDQNNNGLIDDRSELFGGAVGEGFADLASFDSNNDGVITGLDDNFADILVWQDANENGITDANELISLAEAGITSVEADFIDTFNSEAIQTNVLAEIVGETGLTELI